ncbi:MAG: hypothetical protein J3K34DRAFT_159952 [Monoraphidium minutum]|nr:MAG: hypothetical protein J3K34DRAFT_159952 [Monoraphidium minutum]
MMAHSPRAGSLSATHTRHICQLSYRRVPFAAPARRPRAISRLQARSAPVWDESMTLADLKAQLDQAVDAEDYDLAARIRDALQCAAPRAPLLCARARRRPPVLGRRRARARPPVRPGGAVDASASLNHSLRCACKYRQPRQPPCNCGCQPWNPAAHPPAAPFAAARAPAEECTSRPHLCNPSPHSQAQAERRAAGGGGREQTLL